ncbi:MAG TPA: 2-oxo acid dehydrogenase subunit E2, partial [Nannocystaceae bacterium]|nr:2-oxo acid dehydrogenase subunit E2 [Nannocystaceae bacterium]
MATIVQLPRLSDTMEEGAIAKWLVAPGDKVKRGQVIAEIETDKATMEFESFDAGTVLELVASEGQTLPIGAPIAVFGQPGEDAKAALAQGGGKAPEGTKAKDTAARTSTKAKAPPADDGQAQGEADEGEADEGEADETAEKPPAAKPSAAKQPAAKTREPAPARPTNGAAAAPQDGRVPASPLARRIAHENGVALADISGSGPHGRIVKTDVEKAVAAKGEAKAPRASDGPARADKPLVLSQMRKAIARRMAQANAEIPHFYLGIAVDMDSIAAMREQLQAALPDTKISFNDFVVLACARALAVHPEINAYWNGETIVQRGEVHVGIAVAVDDGLVVPVVRDTDRRSLREIAEMARDLGTRARSKKLAPPEMTGSTFSVSNLGMFGIEEFAAVVNPGEGAILAVGAIVDEAVVR